MNEIKKAKIWTQEEIDDIIRRYTLEGETIKSIRVKYKCRSTTITNILTEAGIKISYGKTNRLARHDFFETINTEEKAYFLGLIIADGSVVTTSGRSPNIRLELIDQDILELLKVATNTESPIVYQKRAKRKNPTFCWGLRSKKMAEDLAVQGVVPNKTQVTENLLVDVPEDLKRHLARGLIDGDGSIYFSQGQWHISFTGKHKSFVNDVQELLMGLVPGIPRMKITAYNGIHKFTYGGADTKKVCQVLYTNCNYSINRKQYLADIIVEDIV